MWRRSPSTATKFASFVFVLSERIGFVRRSTFCEIFSTAEKTVSCVPSTNFARQSTLRRRYSSVPSLRKAKSTSSSRRQSQNSVGLRSKRKTFSSVLKTKFVRSSRSSRVKAEFLYVCRPRSLFRSVEFPCRSVTSSSPRKKCRRTLSLD